MFKHTTSVHFISAEGNGNKIMLIPTFVLLYWKKFIFVIGGILSVLLLVLGIFIYHETSSYYKEELHRANFIKRQIDMQKLKESFRSIDQSMQRVNGFMQARGLKSFSMKNVGGEEGFELEDINEVSGFYANYIKELENAITNVPLGRPHAGEVTSHFGTRENPFSGGGAETHSGMDFRGKTGDVVKSTANGKVSFAGVKGGYGNCVIIDHGYNLQTLYGHFSKINVTQGQEIKTGAIVGLVGSTGRSTGPHLHYEVHFKGERINPELYLNFK